MNNYPKASRPSSRNKGGKEDQKVPMKRVNIVKVTLVKEASLLYKDRTIRSPKDAADLLWQYLGEADREHFIVIALNTKNQPTAIHTCHIGSLNASLVHPREVMKIAILSNAAAIVVGHNHPSGNPEPSQEDIAITKKLKNVTQTLEIDLLDHIIIGDGTFRSLKERGDL